MKTVWLLALVAACDAPPTEETGSTETTPTATTSPVTTNTSSTTTPGTDTTTVTSSTTDTTATTATSTTTATFGPVTVSGITTRLHPDINTMLYVEWDQDVAGNGHITYTFENDVWMDSPQKRFEAGHNEQVLMGIPADMDVTFRIEFDSSDAVEGTGRTGSLPSGLPVGILKASDPSLQWADGHFLIGSINQSGGGWNGGSYWKFIIDRQGRVVWYSLTPDNKWTTYIRQSLDGETILYEENWYWSTGGDGSGSKVHRIKLDMTEVEVYETPGLHHAFTELRDGTIVWGSASGNTETLEGLKPDGTRYTIWNCADYHRLINETRRHCQSNAIFWNESDDTFLFSFYTTSSAVELDHKTGETLRYWGDVNTPWTFDPPDSQFSWQHGLTYTADGTLLLSTERYLHPGRGERQETLAREYEVDDATHTLREVWNFGKEQGVYAQTAGEAHRFDNHNTLHNYGSAARLREVTVDGTIVWDVDWESSQLLGRTTFITDLYDYL